MEEKIKKVEGLVAEYKKFDGDLKKLAQSQETYFAQLNENKMVKEELDLLEDDAEIFKSVGPVLVKMELSDAKASVKQRIDRFNTELDKVQESMKDTAAKQDKRRQEIQTYQQELQQQQQQAAQAAVAQG
mmetsp:Transcript_17115/g.19472  ORF Transcript_17115/g.19472 Transcript_17115/m.19472 type:complete len:130 (+) Transcript_17115:123-512(+)